MSGGLLRQGQRQTNFPKCRRCTHEVEEHREKGTPGVFACYHEGCECKSYAPATKGVNR